MLLLVLAAGLGHAARAEPLPADCPSVRPPVGRLPAASPVPADAPINVRADAVSAPEPDIAIFTGNVTAEQAGRRIEADRLRYDRATQQADATGEVTVSEPGGGRYETEEAHLTLDTHVGEAGPGVYRLPDGLGRGDAEAVEFKGPDLTVLSNVRYTTCPPGRDDWFLRARRLDLDRAEDLGTARNVTLAFKGVPLLYLPYLRFPISDERKSGFLLPQLGYGGDLGLVVGAPYYLNLAPNYDATITPRLLSDRGVQLQNEVRYLGRGLTGQLQADYLPNDDVTGDDRALLHYLHAQTLSPGWNALVDLRSVSDKDYLSDFGNTLQTTSTTHLPQIAELNYRGGVWNFTARAADYQTVDRTIAPLDRPYARLPQLALFGLSPPSLGDAWQWRFDGEAVNFQRDEGVTGTRANVAPAVSLPLRRPYGFLVPELGIHHIGYALDETLDDERPSVTAGHVSVDSGLVFERELALGNVPLTQTLEPRLFYLYVPDRDQSDLPIFDTSIPDFTFANLFRVNRFVGGDRIGDANHLTAAVTTRFLDERDGTERLRASIGRIYYFDEQDVTLNGEIVDRDASDLAAEAVAWLPGNWHARATVQWGTEQDTAARTNYYLQYQPARDRILNLGYRYIRGQQAQADVSTQWPVGPRLTLLARSLYSLRDNENVDSYVGFEYRSCCWAARLYAARRITQASEPAGDLTEQRTRFMFELELSGLGRLGDAVETPLGQSLFSFPAP